MRGVVRRGEYLERAVVIPGEATLEGLFHRGPRRPGLVLAPAAPERGGSMESALLCELAWAVTRAGHPTLRFNHRGVGASAGRRDPATRVADLEAAVRHLAASLGAAEGEEDSPPVALLGVFEGAAVAAALALARPWPTSLILVGPCPAELPAGLERLPGRLTLVLAEAAGAEARSAAEALLRGRARGRLEVVLGADQTFGQRLVEVGRIAARALEG
jgi:alpha/beta superfamily hydrolase